MPPALMGSVRTSALRIKKAGRNCTHWHDGRLCISLTPTGLADGNVKSTEKRPEKVLTQPTRNWNHSPGRGERQCGRGAGRCEAR